MSRSRAHRVDLRLDDQELKTIEALAASWGCSVSDALRRLVSGHESRPDTTPTEPVRTPVPEPVIAEPVRTRVAASKPARELTGDEALAELGIKPPPPGTYLGNPFAD